MTPRAAPRTATTTVFDLIVVGAGINGAGIARDAARRGLRVLLVDKGDISAGTTSWATRLIHGGLRYLEHGEVGLVRESLRERERLLRNAVHLVRPLPLLIPIYDGDARGPTLVRLGMIAYDLLSFDKSLDRHRMLGRDETRWRVPGLNLVGLAGAAVYYDAQVEYAERLAVENAIAARAQGATVITYARVDQIVIDGETVTGVAVTDLLDDDGESLVIRAPVVVNVTGPWVDHVLTGAGQAATTPAHVGGTKGSHIVIGPFTGSPGDAIYVEARQDGRPFFIVPWNGQYLIGTTDTRYTGDLNHVEATEDEIDYLLTETNRVFPMAGLTREDVHFTYAGVRPLPYQPDGIEGAISRRHLIHDHATATPPVAGLFSIIGGKLTTYRELAERTVDAVAVRLDRSLPASTTADVPLPGASVSPDETFAAFAARFRAESDLPGQSINHLLLVYGTRASDVLALADRQGLRDPFDRDSGAIAAEIPFAVEQEGAETLADILLRRTMVGLGPTTGVGADEAAAAIACRHLGWTDDRAAREVAAYRAYIARYHPRALREIHETK